MRILVFGAAGRTGRHIVEQALRQGHEVTAFIHDHVNLNMQHNGLRLLRGNICDSRSVEPAMKLEDAVICAIESSGSHSRMLSVGTANIIKAMQEHRIKRFVCLSAVGVLGTDAGLLHRHIIIPLFKNHEFLEKRRQLEEIMRSSLDWIVVRHVRLTDSPRRHRYHVSLVRPIGSKIPRANVADFMLKQVTQNRFLCEMPIVSE